LHIDAIACMLKNEKLFLTLELGAFRHFHKIYRPFRHEVVAYTRAFPTLIAKNPEMKEMLPTCYYAYVNDEEDVPDFQGASGAIKAMLRTKTGKCGIVSCPFKIIFSFCA
jgi:hypothetical protein